jgi:hypothetical protein
MRTVHFKIDLKIWKCLESKTLNILCNGSYSNPIPFRRVLSCHYFGWNLLFAFQIHSQYFFCIWRPFKMQQKYWLSIVWCHSKRPTSFFCNFCQTFIIKFKRKMAYVNLCFKMQKKNLIKYFRTCKFLV